jgi:hypothetical protein
LQTAGSGSSVGGRSHRFVDELLLVSVGTARIGQAVLGEDDERRACVGYSTTSGRLVVEITR